MSIIRRILFILLLQINLTVAYSACDTCCSAQHGIHYCDSSSGLYVCRNGQLSTCYCTRHAIMDLQKLQGCCLWHGGVFKIDPTGLVICYDGGVSEFCSLVSAPKPVASF